jgi:hypothetical protein
MSMSQNWFLSELVSVKTGFSIYFQIGQYLKSEFDDFDRFQTSPISQMRANKCGGLGSKQSGTGPVEYGVPDPGVPIVW